MIVQFIVGKICLYGFKGEKIGSFFILSFSYYSIGYRYFLELIISVKQFYMYMFINVLIIKNFFVYEFISFYMRF